MGLFRRNNHLYVIFIVTCFMLIYITINYRSSLNNQAPPETPHNPLHRRYRKQAGSLYILNNEIISDNSIHDIQNIQDVYYVHITRSVRSMVDGIKMSIEQGASWIYLPSSNQHLRQTLMKFNLGQQSNSLVYTGPNKNDVGFHFIARDFNYPADFKRSYIMGKYETPSIQTVFHADSEQLNFMDCRAPPVAVRISSLYPFTQHNTLYSYKAFWALIPLQINSAVWSMWTGRLVRELEDYIVFHAPPSTEILGTSEGEHGHALGEIRDVLHNWKCDQSATFFTCMMDLSDFLKDKAVFTDDDVSMVTRWIQELLSSGYSGPERKTQNIKINFLHNMLFWPSRGNVKKAKLTEVFGGLCSKTKSICNAVPEGNHPRVFSNILLIIVFNKKGFYRVIDHLETLYRPHFHQILYCAHNLTDFSQTYKTLKNKEISFLDVNFGNGQSGNQCIQNARTLNYDVDGYLHLGDDVMFNIWNLSPLPLDKPWFQKDMLIGKLSQDKVKDVWTDPDWWPWKSNYRGVRKLKFTFNELQKQQEITPKIKTFLDTLAVNSGGPERAFYQASDIHFIPAKLADDYNYFMEFFDKWIVYFEIAIPTVINGLVLNKDIYRLPGVYLWFTDRQYYRDRYKQSDVFFHPLKLASCENNAVCSKFYCEKYLSCWEKF
ncbi:uncharacterized protein LOC126829726 isoform X2 [Patella vulgata]|nr:uncharacterized protein LOC126829726 isoform X2 [Patella vulgata]XP_050415793.1 uncharacterized protein LOC126829726 isoform X2 [Patella vulgata]